jgi:hypothetical protein
LWWRGWLWMLAGSRCWPVMRGWGPVGCLARVMLRCWRVWARAMCGRCGPVRMWRCSSVWAGSCMGGWTGTWAS